MLSFLFEIFFYFAVILVPVEIQRTKENENKNYLLITQYKCWSLTIVSLQYCHCSLYVCLLRNFSSSLDLMKSTWYICFSSHNLLLISTFCFWCIHIIQHSQYKIKAFFTPISSARCMKKDYKTFYKNLVQYKLPITHYF